MGFAVVRRLVRRTSITCIRGLTLASGALLLPASAMAQDITYQPINPTFGGNPFNSSHLLGVASAQNDTRDPSSTSTSSSQASIFASQLQSRLLSALSSQVVDAIFGDNPQNQGTNTFGGQTIPFVRSLDNVTLTITDEGTGSATTIVVPTFVKVN